MASQINSNNIDGAYPVAGQDNDSQGFRDNFTNIKTNFTYASSEITDLQSKVVLKAPLIGGGAVSNNMQGTKLTAPQLQAAEATVVELGTVTGSVTVDYSAGHYQYNASTSGSISLAFTGFPTSASGTTPFGWVTVRLTVTSTAHTVTLPSAVGASDSANSVLGIQGISSNIVTFAETGSYEFVFHSTDGGSTIYLHELTRPRSRFTNPVFLDVSETLTANANPDLAKTTTVINTSADFAGNVANGTGGQLKVIVYGNSSVGNSVVTVDNAGWQSGSAGTITLANTGDACTMQYINDTWYVIGNNGTTIA